jgi:hypothetical protein
VELDRIRWLARQALSGFDTLELDDAVSGAKADLHDILTALDVADDAVAIPLVEPVE